MNEKPKTTWRRGFQFRLSTWLVLVGIVAWAMATRPYMVEVWINAGARSTSLPWGPLLTRTTEFNQRLVYPALALVAFLAWKAFWRIRERPLPTHS